MFADKAAMDQYGKDGGFQWHPKNSTKNVLLISSRKGIDKHKLETAVVITLARARHTVYFEAAHI